MHSAVGMCRASHIVCIYNCIHVRCGYKTDIVRIHSQLLININGLKLKYLYTGLLSQAI